MPDVSPAKWHLAHASWFFETFLLTPHLPGYEPLDRAVHFLFNSYYNGVGTPVLASGAGFCRGPPWPSLRTVRGSIGDANFAAASDTSGGAAPRLSCWG